jgi:hypothetical protein
VGTHRAGCPPCCRRRRSRSCASGCVRPSSQGCLPVQGRSLRWVSSDLEPAPPRRPGWCFCGRGGEGGEEGQACSPSWAGKTQGCCQPVHLRGAGKVAAIRGHQHHEVFHGTLDESHVISHHFCSHTPHATIQAEGGGTHMAASVFWTSPSVSSCAAECSARSRLRCER